MFRSILLTSLPITALFLLTGCPEPKMGKFLPATQGVRYETPTLNGVTGENGEFEYEDGEPVTFKVGDIVLGTAPAKETVTPFDLVGIEPPVKARDIRQATNRIQALGIPTPFETAINISRFLQSADQDGDPNGGLQISEEFLSFSAGKSLDFSQKNSPFLRELNYFVAKARKDGLEPKIPRTYEVLKDLYLGLALKPELFAITQSERDADAEGPEGITTRSFSNYDEQGRLLDISTDGDGDGPNGITSRNTRTYDSRGNEIVLAFDNDGDGPEGITYRTTKKYDEFDNLIEIANDPDGDGPQEVLTKTTYEYDENQNLIKVAEQRKSFDEFRVIRVSYFGYDEKGNRIQIEVDQDGEGPNGITQRQFFTFDEKGRVSVQETDTDGDGPGGITRRLTQVYNENGNVVESTTDNDGDGPGGITRRETTIYDANGYPIKFEIDEDGDGPGGITYRLDLVYDDQGNLLRSETDRDGDGPMGGTYRQEYTYDENLYIDTYRFEFDYNGDGISDQVGIIYDTYSPINTWRILFPF